MTGLSQFITEHLGELLVAVTAGAIAAIRRRLGRKNKVRGIVASKLRELPTVLQRPAHLVAEELARAVNESLLGQAEPALSDDELDQLRRALKTPRAPTTLPIEPPPLPPPPQKP